MIRLSECEEQIMIVVWNSEDRPSLKTVQADVNSRFKHEWRPQTVSTFLARLVRKGYLRMEREGRNAYYYVEVPLEEYRREKLLNLADVLYNGDVESIKGDLAK